MLYTLSLLALTIISLAAAWPLYQLLLSPLAKFPGPKLWASTQFPWHQYNMAGTLAKHLAKLHAQYGPAVRVGPNEISFVAQSVETWRAIYHARPEMPKYLGGTGLHPPYNGVAGIEASDSSTHPRIRKAMSPAFAERALRDQASYLKVYVDKLLGILQPAEDALAKDSPSKENIFDINKLFMLITFDITSDLSVGTSFGGLDKRDYHPWVRDINDGVKAIAFLQFTLHYHLKSLMNVMTPPHLKKAFDDFYTTAFALVDQRLARGEDEGRKDFISYMYAEKGGSTMLSRDETRTSFTTLLVAGSESSASNMSAIIYLSLKHPPVYERMVREIRDRYKNRDEVTVRNVFQLEYFNAVIQEAFRIFPPAPATIPRIVPAGGANIDGVVVPEGTVVGINQWSTYHSALNFTDPDRFIPERWLQDGSRPAKYDSDSRTVLQPFSYGNRDCIGRTLANVEVRLILFSLLSEMDCVLTEPEKDWTDQLQFLSWDKLPLLVQVIPRKA